MSLIVAIEQMIRLFVLAWVDIRRASVFGMLFLFVSLHVVVLAICADPTFPLWGPVTIPIFQWRFGELYLHYPQALIGLPSTGSALRLVVDVGFGPFVAAWCGAAVAQASFREGPHEARLFRQATRIYIPMLILVIVIVVGWSGLYSFPLSRVLEGQMFSYKIRLLLTYGLGLVPIVVLAPLFFVLPALLTRSSSWAGAVRRSVRRFREAPLLPIMIGAVPYVLALPFTLLSHRSAAMAHSLRPELMLVLMIVESIIGMLGSFYVIDASVRLYLKPKDLTR